MKQRGGNNARQVQIARMRDPFMDDFDKRFDAHFDRIDKMMDSPVKTIAGVWIISLVLNLIFWGALIAGVLFGLNHYGVI